MSRVRTQNCNNALLLGPWGASHYSQHCGSTDSMALLQVLPKAKPERAGRNEFRAEMGFGRWFLRNQLPISLENCPSSLCLSGSTVKTLGTAISGSESLPHSTLADLLWYCTSYACWKRTLGTPKTERRTEKSSWERSWGVTVIDEREMDREKPDRGQARGQKLHILSQSHSDANVRCQWTKTK